MGRLISLAFLLVAAVAAVNHLDAVTDAAVGPRAPNAVRPVDTAGAFAPRSVTLDADYRGHFAVEASVNGRTITMLADTGASTVVLTHEDARRAGFNPGQLNYSIRASTANGIAMFAPVMLDIVDVDGLIVRNVRAAVAKPDMLSQSLLGMTFIGRLSSFSLEGGRLVLVE